MNNVYFAHSRRNIHLWWHCDSTFKGPQTTTCRIADACLTADQSWGRLHANVIDYNYNYFEISWLLITITITFFQM